MFTNISIRRREMGGGNQDRMVFAAKFGYFFGGDLELTEICSDKMTSELKLS